MPAAGATQALRIAAKRYRQSPYYKKQLSFFMITTKIKKFIYLIISAIF
jgi:hypothetical protein